MPFWYSQVGCYNTSSGASSPTDCQWQATFNLLSNYSPSVSSDIKTWITIITDLNSPLSILHMAIETGILKSSKIFALKIWIGKNLNYFRTHDLSQLIYICSNIYTPGWKEMNQGLGRLELWSRVGMWHRSSKIQ